ncbi:UDP-xylose and UDP-N-acetylglucosamine transporter [Trichonephila clavata]|uniref:UDP-xylose and UDP-N-acetylglucosamine transporter n=1 Tax=Trichonephila clavata TaxID=2740835 RepID=A0A8X6H9M0_TRICU|nr:UDP-xylose and UDP-N-acetylglucosamine transporter [Trichonephila clavata]
MAILFVVLAIISCCSNVVLLEILMKEIPGCGNVITFSQFLFIALVGFTFTSKFGSVKPSVPIKNYILLVAMFFAVSVSNNCALNFDIPMPLHMIFKSGSLVTSMLLGMLILKKRYSVLKYVSVLLVSVGIFIATFASKKVKMDEFELASGDQLWIGISLLSFSLLMSAGLGIYQEIIYKQYGKHPQEMLFYSHALALPGFIMLAGDIKYFIPLLSKSDSIHVLAGLSIPKLWLCLIGNVITQYICVRSVFTIGSKYSSLTVTMIITCRKFISLIFSIIYFNNPFTPVHWLGTFLVFAGTLCFTDIGNLWYKKTKKVQ